MKRKVRKCLAVLGIVSLVIAIPYTFFPEWADFLFADEDAAFRARYWACALWTTLAFIGLLSLLLLKPKRQWAGWLIVVVSFAVTTWSGHFLASRMEDAGDSSSTTPFAVLWILLTLMHEGTVAPLLVAAFSDWSPRRFARPKARDYSPPR